MSYLGIVFTFVFAGNVLFQYGAGSCRGSESRESRRGGAGLLVLCAVSMVAAAIHSTVFRYALIPLGLEALEPVAYVLLVPSLLYALASILASGPNPALAETGRTAKKLVLSCVVYAAALSAARGGFTFLEAAFAGMAAASGWWCAAVLLDRILERLELEEVPPALAGVPLRFISAGLMAMAFSGVDRLLVSRLAG